MKGKFRHCAACLKRKAVFIPLAICKPCSIIISRYLVHKKNYDKFMLRIKRARFEK